MLHVIVVLYVQQINVLVPFCITESYRKNLFLILDIVYIDGDVVMIFKLFNLSQRQFKLNIFEIFSTVV